MGRDIIYAAKYDNIFEILYRWRFPTLQGLKKKVWLALDKLDLDPKTKVRTSENFENGEIKVELAFKTRDELTIQLEQLFKASHSQAMQDLIRVFKKPEH